MKLKNMPKKFTSEKQKIGKMGENITEKFLVKQGFKIIETNYTKKWGEIDIIAELDNKIHFIEVKSISSPDFIDFPNTYDNVSYETGSNNYRPEDNMHPWKIKRISRTIQTFLLDKKIEDNREWQLDLAIVYLDIGNKKAKIKFVKDIIL